MGIRIAGLLVACVLAGACGDDGGLSTVPDVPATLITPYRVWAFATDDVWILDGTSTIHRFDGATWSTLTTPSTSGLSCIYALSQSDVWLGGGGEVLHYDGSTFTMSDVATPTGLDGVTGVWATGVDDVWVVGNDAIVGHYNGTTWERTIVGAPFKSSIWGSGPTDIYALSTFDLMHYDGSAWTEVTLDGGGGGDGQVWGLGPSDVWLATGDDRVSHFNGTAWTTTELDLVGDVAAVWGTGPKQVWGAGGAGQVAKFDGAWHSVSSQKIGSPYLQQLLSVHGTSANDVWIVGRQLGDNGSTGLIYHLAP